MDVAANAAYTAAWLNALVRARQPESLVREPGMDAEPRLEDHLERALRNAGAESVPGPAGTATDRLIDRKA